MARPMQDTGIGGLIPEAWKPIYHNPLASTSDIAGFQMEGAGAVSFPLQRMRLESTIHAEAGQQANVVLWCPEEFPADLAVSWNFRPLREPGLAILFIAAKGEGGKDLFDSTLARRTGEYDQYHHGQIDTYHISYFRRRWVEEREFHTCNLRKSYGFHLVAQAADPLPDVSDMTEPYRMLVVKRGPMLSFAINELPVFTWIDDGETYGPLLTGGKIGFRQMAPLMAEYSNLTVFGQ